MRLISPGEHDPRDERQERDRGDRDQRAAPAAEPRPRAGRQEPRRRPRRAGCPSCTTPVPVAGRAAKRSLTAIGASAFPRPMPMPTGHVSSTTSHADGSNCTKDAEGTDQDEADRHRPPRADPRREERGHRSEQAHAENGDRAEQAGDGMRGAEVVLDARDQRADRDDLRPKRQRREEERGERAAAAARTRAGQLVRSASEPRQRPSRRARKCGLARALERRRRRSARRGRSGRSPGRGGVVLEAPALARSGSPRSRSATASASFLRDPGDGEDDGHGRRLQVRASASRRPRRASGLPPPRRVLADRVDQLHVPLGRLVGSM